MLHLLQAFPAQQDLGFYQDWLMALPPQGPMAQDHLETTGTQDADLILSNPDDENARALLQFPCEQVHAGVSIWLEKFWATT